MINSTTVANQNIGKSTYVTIDGIVKHCITAPLLELPIDFKEWYKPAGIDATKFTKPKNNGPKISLKYILSSEFDSISDCG